MADSEAAAALLDELAAVDRQAGARSRRPSAAPLTPGWRVLDGLTASDVLDVVAHLVTRPDRRHAAGTGLEIDHIRDVPDRDPRHRICQVVASQKFVSEEAVAILRHSAHATYVSE